MQVLGSLCIICWRNFSILPAAAGSVLLLRPARGCWSSCLMLRLGSCKGNSPTAEWVAPPWGQGVTGFVAKQVDYTLGHEYKEKWRSAHVEEHRDNLIAGVGRTRGTTWPARPGSKLLCSLSLLNTEIAEKLQTTSTGDWCCWRFQYSEKAPSPRNIQCLWAVEISILYGDTIP